jgi:hypothetical protein
MPDDVENARTDRIRSYFTMIAGDISNVVRDAVSQKVEREAWSLQFEGDISEAAVDGTRNLLKVSHEARIS